MSEPEQPSLALVAHNYQGQVVRLRSRDGYVNATALCAAAGKLFGHYNENGDTKAFLVELSADIGIPISELIQSLKGGNPATQGTWVHPQVAIHLAQWLSPAFAVRVSKWVYEWMSGLVTPEGEAWQIFQERIALVYDSVPAGYFCVFKESADLYAAMITGGAPMGAKMVLDISIGIHWAKHWADNGLNEQFGHHRSYPHDYPIRYPQSRSNPQIAKCYPDAALPEFRRWLRENYSRKGLPAYLESLVSQGKLPPVAANETMLAVENRERRRSRAVR